MVTVSRLLLAFVFAPVVTLAAAQQPKAVRIGYLAAVSLAADTPRLQAFKQGLRELGYVEGRDVVIDYRHEDRSLDRLPILAAELAATNPDVLVGVTTNAAIAVKRAAGSVPVVFMGVTDPVSAGLVASLGQPGGNATGVTNMAAILTGKRLEYLKTTLPSVTRIAVLWDPKAPGSVPQWEESKERAKALGLTMYSMDVSSSEQYEQAFASLTNSNPLGRDAGSWRRLCELAIADWLKSCSIQSAGNAVYRTDDRIARDSNSSGTHSA